MYIKNYEAYNNEKKEQVFASNRKFQIKRCRQQVIDSKRQIASNKRHSQMTAYFSFFMSNSQRVYQTEKRKRSLYLRFSLECDKMTVL